jgi:hypothetical protein
MHTALDMEHSGIHLVGGGYHMDQVAHFGCSVVCQSRGFNDKKSIRPIGDGPSLIFRARRGLEGMWCVCGEHAAENLLADGSIMPSNLLEFSV